MDNRTIEEVRENETKLIDEIKQLEWENQLLRNQLEVGKEQYNNLVEEKEELKSLYDSTILEKQKCKEVIDRLKSIVNDNNVSITRLGLGLGILNIKNNLLVILNEVDE